MRIVLAMNLQNHERGHQQWDWMVPQDNHVVGHIDGSVDECQTSVTDVQELSQLLHYPFAARTEC